MYLEFVERADSSAMSPYLGPRVATTIKLITLTDIFSDQVP